MNPVTRKRVILLVASVALGAGLFGAVRARAMVQTLTGVSAKEACSCAFVVEQTDPYCKAFGQVGGFTVDVSIDRAAKAVTSTYVRVSRKARYADGAGCLLDPLP